MKKILIRFANWILNHYEQEQMMELKLDKPIKINDRIYRPMNVTEICNLSGCNEININLRQIL